MPNPFGALASPTRSESADALRVRGLAALRTWRSRELLRKNPYKFAQRVRAAPNPFGVRARVAKTNLLSCFSNAQSVSTNPEGVWH